MPALVDMPVEDVLRWGWMAVDARSAVLDFKGWHATAARQVQILRERWRRLPLHLTYQAMAVMWTGDFAGAASLIAELDAAATGTRFPPYTLLRLRALQGREAEASAAIANAIEQFGGTAVRAH